MTVSPRWPQDDTPAPQSAGDSVAANDSDGTTSPPTLLRLPNLNAVPNVPAAQNLTDAKAAEQTATPPTASHRDSVGQPNGSTPPLSATQSSAPLSSAPQLSAQTSPARAETPVPPLSSQAVNLEAADLASPAANTDQSIDQQNQNQQSSEQELSGRKFPNLSDHVSDAPTGRSWMEVIQQHGVVVLLLLVVVATAVFTGRDRGDSDPEAAIASAVDLSRIENGIAADMPMHSHSHDIKTGVASSPQAAWIPNSKNSTFAKHSAETVNESIDPRNSVTSLEPPRTTSEPNSIASNSGSRQSDVPNNFSQSLDAKTVSNRFVDSTDSDVAFNPPSLEILANSLPDGDSMTAPHSGTSQSQRNHFDSAAPVSSKTPVGISDWMQYLPVLPSATTK